MAIILNIPEQRWECPNCVFTDVTREPNIHTRFHSCRGLRGLTAPMVPAGTKCKIEAKEREDYVGKEIVQYDGNNRPIQSVVTTRDEGMDCAVLAPVANTGGEAFNPGNNKVGRSITVGGWTAEAKGG